MRVLQNSRSAVAAYDMASSQLAKAQGQLSRAETPAEKTDAQLEVITSLID